MCVCHFVLRNIRNKPRYVHYSAMTYFLVLFNSIFIIFFISVLLKSLRKRRRSFLIFVQEQRERN